MSDKFLPIGTVILLKEADKRLMIIGFCPTVTENGIEKTYDYNGCLYPEGVLDSSTTMVFNHEQIEYVYFYGLEDDEEKDFKKRLNEVLMEENNLDQDIELPNSNSTQLETLDIKN